MIRLWLEQMNYQGSGPDGPPGVELDLDDERTAIVVRFPLGIGEAREAEHAAAFPALVRRVEELEAAIREHRANYFDTGPVSMVSVEVTDVDPAGVNHAVPQIIADLWRLIEPNPNGAAARPFYASPFERHLTADEARELAAVLPHYAKELDRAQGRRR
jgi:hypothetical protein